MRENILLTCQGIVSHDNQDVVLRLSRTHSQCDASLPSLCVLG